MVRELRGRGTAGRGAGSTVAVPHLQSRVRHCPGDPSDRDETGTRACLVAVLQFGDDVPWDGTFPFRTRAVFCDFGEGGRGREREAALLFSCGQK